MDSTIDLSVWTYLLTYGHDLDIYGYGILRIGIDRLTGRKIISYVRR